MVRLSAALAASLLLAAAACTGEKGAAPMPTARLATLADVDSASWARLAQRRIFFGHQSVGRNIMDGVAEVLAAEPRVRLAVVETKDAAAMREPGLYHARVGRNTRPDEKEAEFAAIADTAFASGSGVGILKFCYADVGRDTDPEALFASYRQRVAALAARHPGLVLVHVTMPLTTVESPRGYWKNRLLGRPTARDLDALRGRYNALLRAAYEGREPVFDLAALESTREDGSRAFFRRGADTVFTLVPEYTTDGGHLGPAARRRVAEQFLIFLARLPAS